MFTGPARFTSFVLACLLSTLLLIFPQIVITHENEADHNLLMLLMVGNMIGYIHGIGFKGQSTLFRILLSPLIGWPIMIGGIAYSLLKTGFL